MIISLALDGYEDIFSAFDPRPYNESMPSDDFILECKRMLKEEPFGVKEMRLVLPDYKRNKHDEDIIKHRLHSFFLTQASIQEQQTREDKSTAWLMLLTGVLIWLLVSYMIYLNLFHQLLTTILSVIWEPASWFLIWTGAEKLVSLYKSSAQQVWFYRKISMADIVFHSK